MGSGKERHNEDEILDLRDGEKQDGGGRGQQRLLGKNKHFTKEPILC